MYVRKRKWTKVTEKVPSLHLQDPTISNCRELQNPKGKKLPSKSAEKEKGKEVIQSMEYHVIKPHTRPTNKLRLNTKLILNPTLKELVVNVDKDTPTIAQKTQVSRAKSKGKAIKKQKQSMSQRQILF